MVNNNNYKVASPYQVVGAKAGEAKAPKIAKDSVSSISTAKILYGLNDGEISGIVGGGKGIKLEDTPLLDSEGKSNFEGVTWDFRSGTLDQEYIEGFPDISNEIGVGVELKSGTDWIKAVSNPVLSAVRVRLSWNGLRKQDTKSGDVSGYKIDYAIDIKTGTGAYVEVLNTFINDKVTGKYERTHRLALPKSSNGWQIRVRRLTANANLDNIADKMYIESITEVIDQKFTYPHTSLLGIQYDAKTFSRIAKVSVRAKGKLIKIPSNYDAASNTYTGIWNGQFKLEYSDNPAWIFYDLVTSKRYGLGRRIDASMIDKWSLYDLGAYCDSLVPNGEGGTEKRYTCNVYLQSQTDAYQVLSQLSGIFRAITYWSGQQLVLSADVPKDPTYTFTRSNVIDGQFEYTGTRARDRHTVAKVAFDNPKENFKTEYEYIRDEAGIAKFGINVVDISAIGCTSRGQAQRAGLWALKSEQLETRTVSFRTGLEGFNVTVGEVIEVSDELLAGRANGGRITAITADLKTLTVDREAVIKVNDFITVNANDGVSQRRKVTAVSGKLVTVLTPFVGVEAGAVWAISSTDLNTMQFRVMSIKPDEDNIFSITAIQHEPLKYAAVDTGASVKPTNVSIIKPLNVSPPASVALSANYRVVQGQSVATLVIQWSQVKDAVGYAIEWRRNDGNWIKLPLTGNVSAEVEGVYEGNYQARVKSVNSFDVESEFTNSAITVIAGKVGNPKALATIAATGILFGMDIKWSFAAGSEDTNYTEIETATSSTGANTALLGQFSYPTDKTTVNGLQGGLKVYYRGRIVDKLGNISAWSSWISGTTDNSASKVLSLLTGQITQSQLYTDLSTKIDKIDTNKVILDTLGVNVSVINTDLNTAKTNIATAQTDITKAKSDILSTSGLVTTARADITKAKADILATDGILTTAKADIITAKGVADTAKADAAANKTTLTALNTTVGANKTAVDSSIVTLTNKDTALTNLYTGLKSEYDTNKAAIATELTTLTNKDIALTSSIDSLTTSVGANTSAISTNNTALVAKDTALTNSITALTSDYNTNKASVTSSLSTLTTKDTALTNSINSLTTSVGTNTASIGTINTAISTTNGAVASNKTEINAKFDALEVGGRNLLKASGNVLNTADYAMGVYYFTESIKAGEEVTVTLWGTLAEGKTGFALYNSGGSSGFGYPDLIKEGVYRKTFIWREVGTNTYLKVYQAPNVASGTNSVINRIKLERGNRATDWTPAPEDTDAAISNIDAAITAEALARSSADASMTSTVNTLRSDYDTNKASVTSSLTTLTNKDVSLTNSITSLTTTVGNNSTAITNEATARSSADTALTNTVNALTTRVGTAESSITTNNTALVAKDTALTNSITALTTSVGTNTASIGTLNTAMSTANTSIATNSTNITTKFNEAKSYADLKTSILVIDSKTKKFINPVNYSGNASSSIGYLVIETPITPNRMCSIKIGGYNYNNTQNTIGLTVGFYNTATFANTGYESFGSYKISSVQLAKKDADNKAVLIIGLPNSAWSYPKIVVEEALVGYTASPDTYLEGWSVSIKTDISAYTNLSNVNGVDIQNTLIETSAAITSEATARSSADTALTNTVNAITARVGTAEASISTNNTALVAKDVALTNSITALTTTVGNNTTAISTEATTRTNADNALSTRITTAQSKADSNAGRITTAETTIASQTGAIATLRTDLVASYTIQDTRSTDEPPSYYYTNYPRQTVQEFKQNSVFTTVIGAGTYILLETNVKWSSTSGGAITQKAITDDNRFYIRMSSSNTAWTAWLEQEDVIGSAAKVAAAKLALDNRINTADARITAEKTVSANATSAVASNLSTLTTTVNGHTSSISTQQTSINGLNAQYTVNVDVGGRISGFGLASSSTVSDFAVRADKFYIAPVSGTSKGVIPFMVTTATSTINGTSVPAGTYIQSAYIHDGAIDSAKIKSLAVTSAELASASVTTAKIANLAVDTAQIATAAIENAKIANGAITTAKIGSAQIDTLQIKGDAVTVARAQFIPTYTIPDDGDVTYTLATLSIDAGGGNVLVDFGFDKLYTQSKDSYSAGNLRFDIYRDGTLIKSVGDFVMNERETRKTGQLNNGNDVTTTSYGQLYTFISIASYIDTPSSGNHTYVLKVYRASNNDYFDRSSTLTNITFRLSGAKR